MDLSRTVSIPELVSSNSALLVIDMQNGFCHTQGALSQAGIDVEAMMKVIPNVKKLVRVCRGASLPIIWSLVEYYPEPRAKLPKRLPNHKEKENVKGLCLRGSWDAELVDELKSEAMLDDYYVRKQSFSAFYNTNLEVMLRTLDVSTLVICGVSSNVCVESTARDAYFREYDVVVVRDCIATQLEDLHQATVKNVDMYLGITVTLEQIQNALAKTITVSH